jgi:hypothetical protein
MIAENYERGVHAAEDELEKLAITYLSPERFRRGLVDASNESPSKYDAAAGIGGAATGAWVGSRLAGKKRAVLGSLIGGLGSVGVNRLVGSKSQSNAEQDLKKFDKATPAQRKKLTPINDQQLYDNWGRK